MWLRHWKLTCDPFPSIGGPYVATPAHDEAVARLVYAIRSGERLALLRAESGLGKSTVLARALVEARAPGLRVARSTAAIDGASLYEGLARSLRLRSTSVRSQTQAWRAIADAARMIAAERGRLAIVVDDAHLLADRIDLERLLHLAIGSMITLVILERPDGSDGFLDAFPIPLSPLTRSETAAYLSAKLRPAGRTRETFSPEALTRLHSLTEGVPRAIDRHARTAMQAASVWRLEEISVEVVEGTGRQIGAVV